MGMVINDLADLINQALGPPLDNNGSPIPTTAEMKGYAKAVIMTLQGGSFAHAPGTVVGAGAPSGPLSAGAAAGGLFVGLSSGTWVGALTAAFPSAPPANLNLEASASIGYLTSSGLISFAPGQITGSCTATPTSPGILAGGAGSGGLVAGLVGAAWAAAVLSALGTPGPLASPVYTAVANYIMANAAFAYPSGTVTGTFAAGGGALIAGAGAGGTIA